MYAQICDKNTHLVLYSLSLTFNVLCLDTVAVMTVILIKTKCFQGQSMYCKKHISSYTSIFQIQQALLIVTFNSCSFWQATWDCTQCKLIQYLLTQITMASVSQLRSFEIITKGIDLFTGLAQFGKHLQNRKFIKMSQWKIRSPPLHWTVI